MRIDKETTLTLKAGIVWDKRGESHQQERSLNTRHSNGVNIWTRRYSPKTIAYSTLVQGASKRVGEPLYKGNNAKGCTRWATIMLLFPRKIGGSAMNGRCIHSQTRGERHGVQGGGGGYKTGRGVREEKLLTSNSCPWGAVKGGRGGVAQKKKTWGGKGLVIGPRGNVCKTRRCSEHMTKINGCGTNRK